MFKIKMLRMTYWNCVASIFVKFEVNSGIVKSLFVMIDEEV